MKVGDLVRYKDWFAGRIGRIIAIDNPDYGTWIIEWYDDNVSITFDEEEEYLEVINESR